MMDTPKEADFSLPVELRRRTLGDIKSKLRLEKNSKSLLCQRDNQYRFIGEFQLDPDCEQVYESRLKITSDGEKIVVLSNCADNRDRVSIYINPLLDPTASLGPTNSRPTKVAEFVIYNSHGWRGKVDPIFDENERRIAYNSGYYIYSMELETGLTIRSDMKGEGRYLGPFKFNKDTLLALNLSKASIKRTNFHLVDIPLGSETVERSDSSISRYYCHHYRCMDVNPLDFSTMVMASSSGKLELLNLKKQVQMPVVIGRTDECLLASVDAPEKGISTLKFSPDGRRIAAICPNTFLQPCFLNIYDADCNLALIGSLPLNEGQFCWYDERRICFFKSDHLCLWDVDGKIDNIIKLCPGDGYYIYVHPTLPLLVHYKPTSHPDLPPQFKLWSI